MAIFLGRPSGRTKANLGCDSGIASSVPSPRSTRRDAVQLKPRSYSKIQQPVRSSSVRRSRYDHKLVLDRIERLLAARAQQGGR